LFVPKVLEGNPEDIQMTKIVKEISKIIDEGVSQKHSIQVKDAIIFIKIQLSK
jgi:hypothetical protein